MSVLAAGFCVLALRGDDHEHGDGCAHHDASLGWGWWPVMSLHVLQAGAGCRYLLRTTAAGDGATSTDGLAAYYAASGTPPGVWVGGGLAGLNDGHGLPDGLPVDETTLGRLFGHGADPVTGQPLGRGLATRRPGSRRRLPITPSLAVQLFLG